MPPAAVVWFRNDLRLSDNPALVAAAAVGAVIPLYIYDESRLARRLGDASRWWLDKSLRRMAADLAALGAPLVLRRGRAGRVLNELLAETGASSVYWNRVYDTPSVLRDSSIKADLRSRGVGVHSFNGSLLIEPWAVRNKAGEPFRVFTPFWRAARAQIEEAEPFAVPKRLRRVEPTPRSEGLADWQLHPVGPDWSLGFHDWTPGESGAWSRLTAFLAGGAKGYVEARNSPALLGTSRLSPHLHFGEVSPRQVWAATIGAEVMGDIDQNQTDGFLRQLGWREFNHHLGYHFPKMEQEGFNSRFRDFPWRDDPAGVESWRRGRTGFPIVDAGMRELWSTGWMHNRVRMIAASFLTKDLMADWRIGESWFWNTLVDADLANNVSGWQWVAGVGADAAPYFRIFNPVLQGVKFDPQGSYVRHWLPELAGLPDRYIHEPWRAEQSILAEARVRLGVTYPAPIIDHAEARSRALAAYERSV